MTIDNFIPSGTFEASVKIAAIQITTVSDKETNYKKARHYVQKGMEQGVEFFLLPEHWEWLGKPEDKREAAESAEGPSIRFLQKLAKEYNVIIVAGSITEKNGKKGPYNTCVVVHSDGTLGKKYRKIHLFDTDLPGHTKESDFTSAGSEVVMEDFGWGRLGLTICYDVRFPELYQQLSDKGADLIAVPSNFTAVTGPPHWEVLLRARAIENQCFVIAADQTGMTGTGWEAHGHSMIIDPWGEILAIAGREEGMITADIDFSKMGSVRTRMPVLKHRRL